MIDTHAHVMFDSFDADREAVMGRARQAGVSWIEVGTDVEQSGKAVALAQEKEGVWASVGVHPSDIGALGEQEWKTIGELLNQPKVVAVGEVGFDFYRGGTRDQQEPVLRRFLLLARERNLPVIFHVRSGAADAHDALLEVVGSKEWQGKVRGVVHTFSGTVEQAKRYLELGLYLSFSGVVTFKKAADMQAAAIATPLERMLVETDCPFLAPEPYRGKRNEPAYVQLVVKKMAQLRQMRTEEVIQATHKNAQQLFQLTHI
jgi:TatD DNase family protein